MTKVLLGLESFLESVPDRLKKAKLGLVMNQASVTSQFRYASMEIARTRPGMLRALFSPQHGIFGEQQANMIESDHGFDPILELPVYSLYSETRQPKDSMLEGIDCLVIDLQDVGTRVYTFAWTMLECMRACEAHHIPVVVLDRPNPIGGLIAEGPMLGPAFTSFVGELEIPLRHGLTMAELALYFKKVLSLDLDLITIPLQGWNRSMYYPETGLSWVAPSPNMPRFETTVLYPGMVLLEGTNLSEGRGTTLPFEMCGAPFLDPFALHRHMETYPQPGLLLRPVRFCPTFDKGKGQSCGGIAFHLTDPKEVRSIESTVAMIAACNQLAPDHFEWLPPPYEYEYQKMPIDILFGNERLRTRLKSKTPVPAEEIRDLVALDLDDWFGRVELLYR